jgi:hypothetical protein
LSEVSRAERAGNPYKPGGVKKSTFDTLLQFVESFLFFWQQRLRITAAGGFEREQHSD